MRQYFPKLHPMLARGGNFPGMLAKIKENMSESEVVAILGRPDDVRTQFDPGGIGRVHTKEIWCYGTKGHLKLSHSRLRLHRYKRPNPRGLRRQRPAAQTRSIQGRRTAIPSPAAGHFARSRRLLLQPASVDSNRQHTSTSRQGEVSGGYW